MDDAPAFNADWRPARHWREPEPTKFTNAERARMAIVGLLMLGLSFAILVVAFCYF